MRCSPAPMRQAPIDDDVDLDLVRSFRTARQQRQATVRTDAFGCRQFDGFRADRQMAVVPALGTGPAPLVAAGPRRLGRAGVVELIGAIAAGLLFRLASEQLGLQLAVLTPKVFVCLFQRCEAPYGIRMPALPIAGLLAPFEVFPP